MTIESAETYLKVGSLIVASIFFVWKMFTGWLFINLKIKLTLERVPHPSGDKDLLSITVELEKGTTDSLWLRSLAARITQGNNLTTIDMSDELSRLTVDLDNKRWPIGNDDKPLLTTADKSRKITLSPGEQTSIACWIEVERDSPVIVEVALFGTRPCWAPGFQWRASAVSLRAKVA